jgi:kynureninase
METDAMTATTAELDARDPLAALRAEFRLPLDEQGAPAVYLCGHSLGLAPRRALELVREELSDWAQRGVEGHFHARRPWMPYHTRFTSGLALLAGAQPGEVVAMNSLTVNLHLLLVSFYRPTRARSKLLIERPAFPSDRYAAESQVRFHGFDPAESLIELGARPGEDLISMEDLAALLDEHGDSIATVMLPGVQYLTGQLFDMEEITRLAHARGCLVGFDLAHAIGNVPLALNAWDVDFAVWCSYKYLNGGPGAIGGAFVHERHARSFDLPRFAGWWGHDAATRFEMGPRFEPISGAEGWQLSNPPIFAMAPLLASLDLFERAGIARLREKSIALTSHFATLVKSRLAGRVRILTPPTKADRGSQLSLRLELPSNRARAVHQELIDRHFFCDWREPDVIRAAPVPLYNTFEDVARFVAALAQAVER